MEISRIYLLFVQSLAIYVIMFNIESLYCILLNKIKSNQIKLNYFFASSLFHIRWQNCWSFSVIKSITVGTNY